MRFSLVFAPEGGELGERLRREVGHALEIDRNQVIVDVAQREPQICGAVAVAVGEKWDRHARLA